MANEKIIALTFIIVEHTTQDEILEAVQQLPQVKHYSIITGEFDGIIEFEVDTMSELYENFRKLDKIPGIKSTNTHLIMKRFDFQ